MAIQNTTAGLKVGGASGKIGFHGAAPVVKQVGAAQAQVTPGNVNGAIAAVTFTPANVNGAISALTFTGAGPTAGECEALRDACEALADDVRAGATAFGSLRDECETLADDVRAIAALANALQDALVKHGLIKGSA